MDRLPILSGKEIIKILRDVEILRKEFKELI